MNRAADLTLDRLFKLEDHKQHMKPTKIPLCIIKYGPPGSGKTSADAYVKKLVGVNLDNFINIDKDIPLTSIREFRTGSLLHVQKGVRYEEGAEALQEFQDSILNEPNRDGLSINDKIPIAIQRAFDYHLNVLWETTAQSARSQALMEEVFRAIPSVYRIIVLFPIVSEETSLARVRSRAAGHLKERPPYFRPVPADRVKSARVESYRYFTEKIMPRVLDGSIYQLFCYNNEGRPHTDDYKIVMNRNIARRKRTTKRVARGWRFGLNAKGHRRTIRAALR